MLEVSDLVVRYGDVVAVDGVSFCVEKGEIFGLLGPNGAGKSSTIKAVVGLVDFEGIIKINGKAIVTLSATSKIGARRDIFSGLGTVLILFLLGFVVIYTPVIVGYVCKVLYGTFLMPVAVTSLVELIFSLTLLNVL